MNDVLNGEREVLQEMGDDNFLVGTFVSLDDRCVVISSTYSKLFNCMNTAAAKM